MATTKPEYELYDKLLWKKYIYKHFGEMISTPSIGIFHDFKWYEDNGFTLKEKEEPVFTVTPLY